MATDNAATGIGPVDLGSAQYVPGAVVDDTRFVATMSTDRLLSLVPDPRRSESPRDRDTDVRLAEVYSLRSQVQRLFEGAKKRNVASYARYIAALQVSDLGATPTVVLWTKERLDTIPLQHGTGLLALPFGITLVAIDGETQLAARHDAVGYDERVKAAKVAVEFHHGRPADWARQVFHDFNTLAVRPNVALSVSMDTRDRLTAVANLVETRVPYFSGRVNKVRRQLAARDPEVMTIAGLRGACATLYPGIAGGLVGVRPHHVDDEDVEDLESTAIAWFSAVADAIGPEIENRVLCLAGAPAVFASIGAVGHAALRAGDERKRHTIIEAEARRLREVDWSRRSHWAGIAGKWTPSGKFSTGGSKETAHAIFAALSQESSEAYKAVRRIQAPEGRSEEVLVGAPQ